MSEKTWHVKSIERGLRGSEDQTKEWKTRTRDGRGAGGAERVVIAEEKGDWYLFTGREPENERIGLVCTWPVRT